jgi:hypothetical protein
MSHINQCLYPQLSSHSIPLGSVVARSAAGLALISVRRSKPDGDDFAAVVRLRDAARSFLLAHCHAPDLVQEKMDLSAWAQL